MGGYCWPCWPGVLLSFAFGLQTFYYQSQLNG